MGVGTTRYFLAPNVNAWNLGGTVAADDVVSDSGARWIRQAAPNEGKKSAGRQLSDSLNKVSSFYPLVKFGHQAGSLALQMKPHDVIGKPLQGITDILGTTKKALLIPRICHTVLDVVYEKYSGDWLKTAKNWVEMVGSLVTAWGVFGSTVGVSTKGSGPTMMGFDLMADSLDLTIEGKKLSRNVHLINQLPLEVQDPADVQAMVGVVKESRNVNILKMCKIVASLAVTIIAALALVMSAFFVVPPAALFIIGIATSIVGIVSTVFGISSTFYENTRVNMLLSEPNNMPLRSATLLPVVA